MTSKKRIIICADGTWNRPEKDISLDFPTNVLKLARGIRPVAQDKVPQVVFYDWGIGSDGKKISGGVLGKGLDKNIQDGYRFIVQNYRPGDEIYLFGFSRGAFTVRSLAGFMNNCGILKREHANRIHEAFEFYRDRDSKTRPGLSRAQKFRDAYSGGKRGPVHFIGVWDTVGALGVPIFLFNARNRRKYAFHDTQIGSNVRVARHALAINEYRNDFRPTLWDKKAGADIEQVWFAGSHSDVGGSQKPDAAGHLLSDVALGWVMDEASEVGLSVEGHLVTGLKPSGVATHHLSRKGMYLSLIHI